MGGSVDQDREAEAAAIVAGAVGERTRRALAQTLARPASPPDPRRKYRQGMCDAMALALHRKTGLPLGLIAGVYDDGGEEAFEYCHAVVRVGEDSILDVDGCWKMSQMRPSDGCFASTTTGIRLVDAGVEEVTYVFTIEGVSEEQIAEALAFIEADPELMAEVEHFGVGGTGPAP